MKCPRCGSSSVVSSHDTVSCLSCGHALAEPAYRAGDKVSVVRGAPRVTGPAWTEAEHALWAAAPRV
jgi:hypothetical protein